MAPWSRLAASSKPNVAYLDLNFSALLKKQTTLPSLVYAGIPYHVLAARPGAASFTIACSRSAIARSVPVISAIFASAALSPSALAASAFSSRARSLIAARSSALNPFVAVVLLAVFFSAMRATSVHRTNPGRLPALRLVAHRPRDVPDLQQPDLALVDGREGV